MFQKFRKVGPKCFSKKYFLRKFFIEFPNKNIFQPTFSREKKSRNVDIFAIFSLENVGRKNIFVRKFNEHFSKTIFSIFFPVFSPVFLILKIQSHQAGLSQNHLTRSAELFARFVAQGSICGNLLEIIEP